MEFIRARMRTMADARGHKALLLVLMLFLLSIPVEQLWPEIKLLLQKWNLVVLSEQGDVIIGIPYWMWALTGASFCFGLWMLEYATAKRKELEPKLAPIFDPDRGGISETFLSDAKGNYIDNIKYVRLGVTAASRKTVRECSAAIVRLERRVDLTRTDVIWDQDELPLMWAFRIGPETSIHYLRKKFVDVGAIEKSKGNFVYHTEIPNRIVNDIAKPGTYIVTVVVTGEGLSETESFEIETDGTYSGLKARRLNGAR